MTDTTSPELVDRFDAAAALSRAGRHEEALALWNQLLEPDAEEVARRRREGAPMMSGRFLGVSLMRRAWVLMDLGRHADARAALEATIVEACLSQLTTTELYEYFFSLANCCGQVGDLRAMDRAMTRAIHLAADELGDAARCQLCWHNLMQWGRRAEAWRYLAKECPTAVRFAENAGLARLAAEARSTLAEALERLSR